MNIEHILPLFTDGLALDNLLTSCSLRFNFAKNLPLKNFDAIGHYTFNPGGVPTAMITARYIVQEILKRLKIPARFAAGTLRQSSPFVQEKSSPFLAIGPMIRLTKLCVRKAG